MGWYESIEHNVILRDIYERAKAEGIQQGIEQGIAQAIVEQGAGAATRTNLKTILEVKFSRVPDWAASKIDRAPSADLQRWLRQSVKARSLRTLLDRK